MNFGAQEKQPVLKLFLNVSQKKKQLEEKQLEEIYNSKEKMDAQMENIHVSLEFVFQILNYALYLNHVV
ncbi:MAG: hypothetical protein MJ252_24935 [archaeon]|nr:hypothetical protein [archaeon]